MKSFFLSIGRILPKGSFLSEVTILTFGTIAAQAVSLATLPILTRLYSPSEFGVLAVFASILGIIMAITSLCYERAIPLPKKDGAAFHTVVLSTIIVCIVSIGVAVVVYMAKSIVLIGLNNIKPWVFIFLLTVGVLTAGLYQVSNYWAVRRKEYNVIAYTRVQQGLGGAGVQLILGWFQTGAIGLLIGQVIGQAAGIVRLMTNLKKSYLKKQTPIHSRGVRWALKRYRRFPLFDAWATLLYVAGARVPALLFATLYSSTLAGFYNLSLRVVSAPMTLVGSSIAQVLLPRVVAAKGTAELPILILKIQSALSRGVFIPFFVFMVVAPKIFGLIFGHAWDEAGLITMWVALGVAFQFVYSPIAVLIVAFEAQKLNLVFQLVLFFCRLSGIYIGFWMHMKEVSIALDSIISAVGYCVGLMLFARMAKLSVWKASFDLFKEAFIAALAALTVKVASCFNVYAMILVMFIVVVFWVIRLLSLRHVIKGNR